MKLVLHNYWRSSASYRVRIGLGLKQLAYEYVAVDILHAGQHDAAYKAKNPMAQVPTLAIEDGARTLYLTQSLPILEYVDERWPELPLLPRGTSPAALELRHHVRALCEIVNAGMQPLQNTGTTNAIAALGAEVRPWVQRALAPGLAALETAVAERMGVFAVGDAPSLADCFLVPQLFAARRFGCDVDGCPRLRAIEAACLALPAFAAAHPDRQPDAKPT